MKAYSRLEAMPSESLSRSRREEASHGATWPRLLFESVPAGRFPPLIFRIPKLLQEVVLAAALKEHLNLETFENPEIYGKDKAKFGIVQRSRGPSLDTAIYYGAYAYLWQIGGNIMSRF